MRLTRYEPFGTLQHLQREMNRLFDPVSSQENSVSGLIASDWTPDVDVREENDRFVIHADVPGVNPSDIDITLENGVLSIKGKREFENKSESDAYRHVERVRGSFMRSFTLPNTADADHVSAKTKDGVLEIIVPKEEKAQPRRITVEA